MRLIITFIFTVVLSACSTTYENQDIVGSTMPTMTGETLEKDTVEIPSMFNSPLTLLLVGYKQDSQFDIDREPFSDAAA